MAGKKDGLIKTVVIILWSVIALFAVGSLAWLIYAGLSPRPQGSHSSVFPTSLNPSTPTFFSLPTASLTPFIPDDTTSIPVFPPTNTPQAASTETLPPLTLPSPPPAPAVVTRPSLFFVGADGCSVQEYTPEGTLLSLTQQTPASGCSHPELSPDGSRLAFLMPGSYSSLYVMNVNGTGLVKISSGYVYDFSWSTDSRRLVFAKNIPEQGRTGLYFVNADGSSEAHSAYPGISIAPTSIHLAWSPDGNWIYAPVSDPTGADQSLPFALNANGGDFVQLGSRGIDPTLQVSWSPDSRSLSYLLQGYDYGYSVTLLNFLGIDGLPIPSVYYDDPTVQSATLSPEGRFTSIPYWSPGKGQAVLVGKSSLVAGEYQLLILDKASGTFRLLANVFQPAEDASWTPAGDRIAFLLLPAQDSGASIQLNVINADGTNLQTIAQGVADTLPVWAGR